MKYNQKLLLVAFAALAIQLLSFLFGHHFLLHSCYLITGLAIGAVLGRIQRAPRLKQTTYSVENCKLDESGKASQGDCTVVVMRQYCHIIDTPTPQQICFWVREEHKGRWNPQYGCCEAVVDGRLVCVRPS